MRARAASVTAVAFGTLQFVRTLRDKAKMSSEQAEGLADKIDIAAVRTDIEALRLASRADLADTKAEIVK